MPIFPTFTKREKARQRAGETDVYQYDSLPEPFRVQVIHIWKSSIGPYFVVDHWTTPPASNRHWQTIHDVLARERGVFHLAAQHDNPFEACQKFILTTDTGGAFDLIELSFRVIDRVVREQEPYVNDQCRISQDPDGAIDELNHRFREHSLGYQFVGGDLVRVDSQLLHQEAVKPAISLLAQEGFEGPNEEFMKAHEHYRHGRYEESISDALKAFESTMKAICDARKWAYGPNATSKPLIRALLDNALIPSELESQFTALSSVLESGLPVVRNRMGGHGQGTTPRHVPGYMASYALHLAASNIVFLIEAYRAKR